MALPGDDTNLETNYSAQDYLDVDTKNDVRVDQAGTDQFIIHQFKDFVGAEADCTLEWEGQSTQAPSHSEVFLQIYNQTDDLWETVDSDATTAANTDFILTSIVADLTEYKDASNIISCRVYQQAII